MKPIRLQSTHVVVAQRWIEEFWTPISNLKLQIGVYIRQPVDELEAAIHRSLKSNIFVDDVVSGACTVSEKASGYYLAG